LLHPCRDGGFSGEQGRVGEMPGYGQEVPPARGAREGCPVLRKESEALSASRSRDLEGSRQGEECLWVKFFDAMLFLRGAVVGAQPKMPLMYKHGAGPRSVSGITAVVASRGCHPHELPARHRFPPLISVSSSCSPSVGREVGRQVMHPEYLDCCKEMPTWWRTQPFATAVVVLNLNPEKSNETIRLVRNSKIYSYTKVGVESPATR